MFANFEEDFFFSTSAELVNVKLLSRNITSLSIIRGVQCRISDPIRSENLDIRKFRIGGIAFRIRFEIFEYPNFSDRITGFSNRVPFFRSDYRIFGSGSLIFLKNHDPYPIRIPEIFPDTRSEISKILKSNRVSEISDRIFLHTPIHNMSTKH